MTDEAVVGESLDSRDPWGTEVAVDQCDRDEDEYNREDGLEGGGGEQASAGHGGSDDIPAPSPEQRDVFRVPDMNI